MTQTRLLILLFPLYISCSQSDPVVVTSQVTGVFNTNCYLVYTERTREAALVDVGDSINQLLNIIQKEQLSVRYLLVTHAHPDHVFGILQVRRLFPNAMLAMSKEEYEDMKSVYANWETRFPEPVVQQIRGNTAVMDLFNMDYGRLGEPGMLLGDQDRLDLGNHTITAYHSPGHARGSICYHIAPCIFTGDELFYRSVGNTQTSPSSSWEDQVESIRRLYRVIPDSTIVYPGHGQSTRMGFEKIENPFISESHARPR